MMKRISSLFLVAAIGIVGLIASTAAASVQDFTIKSFSADYYLSKDEQGRSEMRVREVIVAEFPDYDQNHGIERAIPNSYDGRTVSLNVTSVMRSDTEGWNFQTRTENDNLVLRIGDADTYVHGEQTYIIDYELRDVTKAFPEGDELYWDVNGAQWQQTFEKVSATLHLEGDLGEKFDSRIQCFTGITGSDEKACNADISKNDNETVISFAATRALTAGENLTFVAGFDQNTFQPYQPTLWERVIAIVLIIFLPIYYVIAPIALFAWGIVQWRKRGRDAKGRGTIIPQYVQPREMSVVQSSVVLNQQMPPNAISATIIDLAVRHYLKLYATEEKGLLGSKKQKYELELIRDPSDLREDEQQVVRMIFKSPVTVGDRIKIDDLSKTLYTDVAALGEVATKRAVTDGLLIRNQKWLIGMLVIAIVIAFISLPFLNIPLFLAGLMVGILGFFMPARTTLGVERYEYLKGLKEYMKLAEADRLKVLQSPQGAVTEAIDPNDKAQVVKLYEKLLPYAMLLGIEKDWAEQFAKLYTQPPDWYSGNTSSFNAAMFASSLNGFSTAAASSFSPPSSSSSSGFSGGGSSGGGGGGGGGGGW